MFIHNGYRWTYVDALLAVAFTGFFIFQAISTILETGLSLASIAGSIWGFGTLIFIFINMLPVFGRSIEAEQLLEKLEKEGSVSKEEAQIILQRKEQIAMNPQTVKRFFLFFFTSGVLTLIGIITQT